MILCAHKPYMYHRGLEKEGKQEALHGKVKLGSAGEE